MSLSTLEGSAVYDYVSTWIPRKVDVEQRRLYDEYNVTVLPQYMSTLGTMCDYGVRVRFPNHEFGYIKIGMAMHKDIPEIEKLICREYLTAEDAYILSTYRKTGRYEASRLSDAMWKDYAVLTERAVGMYKSLQMNRPVYGRYYQADGKVHSIECDCASDESVFDMKISRTSRHNKEYWTQVLLYSLLAYRRDQVTRTRIGLVYPVQGIIKQFTIHPQEYIALVDVFNRLYDEEIVCI